MFNADFWIIIIIKIRLVLFFRYSPYDQLGLSLGILGINIV